MLINQLCCASRGRNPYNPSDRRSGIYVEQRLELNNQRWSNTITSVQKDNYILEIYEREDTETTTLQI